MQQVLNFGTETHKIIRRHAPVTSIEAGKSVDTTQMERTIFELIRKQPKDRGLTAKEAARILNKELNQISGRFTGLKMKALIELVPKTKRENSLAWRSKKVEEHKTRDGRYAYRVVG